MLTMFYFLHSLCVWKSQLSHLLKSAIRFKLSLTLVDDRLYLPISTLSSCRLICCRCAMSRGGPPISSPPHPQIAGYGGLSYCNQQQQHITPPPIRVFPRPLFPIATITYSIWAVPEKKQIASKCLWVTFLWSR